MYIDFNQIARVGKVVALLGFFLPWVTVSCSNTEILSATGWQLMTGDPQPVGPLAGMDNQDRADDAEPSVVIIAAFAAILVGFVCSLFTRMQAAAITMLVTSVLGIGISYYGVENMRGELRHQITEAHNENTGAAFGASQSRELSQAVASQVTVKEEEGYIVTNGCLVLAAVFSLLTLFRRRKPGEEAPPAAPS
jgi:hypothetical protein